MWLRVGLVWTTRGSGRGVWVVGKYFIRMNPTTSIINPWWDLRPTTVGEVYTLLFAHEFPQLPDFASASPVYVVIAD